jgi:hypothetical protein
VTVEYEYATKFGMTGNELVFAYDEFMEHCFARIQGPGREQYEKRRDNGGVFQAFEEMTPREILRMAREEVQDLGVYACMTDIRLARLEKALEVNDTIGDAR